MEGKTNGLCNAGFVVSLGSLFLGLWGLTGLVGVALSAVGRSQAENNGQKTGLGTAGIILGVIGALWCWVMLVIAMETQNVQTDRRRGKCSKLGKSGSSSSASFWLQRCFSFLYHMEKTPPHTG